MTPNHENGSGSQSWTEYRRLVLDCIDEARAKMADVEERLADIDLEISSIKMKIAFVAGIAGFIGSLIPVAIQYWIASLK